MGNLCFPPMEPQAPEVYVNGRQRMRLAPLALHDAARYGNAHMVKMLLNEGYDVDVQDRDGKTPLMLAIEFSRKPSIIMKLLLQNSNIYMKDKSGKDAMQMALNLDPLPKKEVEQYLYYLENASLNDSKKLAMMLIIVGCPLYTAASLTNNDVFRAMLANGCSVDTKEPITYKTALHIAVELRNYQKIKLLIDYGADVNAVDADHKIPFALYGFFTDSEKELEMVKMFIDHKTAFTTHNHSGSFQFESAMTSGNTDVLRLFMRSKIDWCVVDGSGRSPFYYLACNPNFIINQFILEDFQGKVVNAPYDRRTHSAVLFLSVRRRFLILVEFLLTKGVDPNVQNLNNCTPLFAAARFRGNRAQTLKNEQILRVLLQNGADPQLHCIDNKTAFDIIIDNNLHLAESLVGQLAINESLGIPVTDSVQSTINSCETLYIKFQLCRKVIAGMKCTTFNSAVSLFNVFTDKEKTLAGYARNAEFLKNWELRKNYTCNAYYCQILETKYQKTMQIVRLRKSIGEIICNLMNIEYDAYPSLVDKITDYIIF